jgi:hypothetical protein
MESSAQQQERAYGSVSMSCDANGGLVAQGRLGRQRRRFLIAISGIMCLVAAHCLSGFVIYQQWHRKPTQLVANGDDFVSDLGDGVIGRLESSIVRKSVTREQPKRVHNQKSEYLPPKTIRRDILNGWWQDLKPDESSLRQEGEAFLSAYKSVEKQKVPQPFFCSLHDAPAVCDSHNEMKY